MKTRIPRGRFKFKYGERVIVLGHHAQIWKVYSPHPERGMYYLEPASPNAAALASLLPYGMLAASVEDMESYTRDKTGELT